MISALGLALASALSSPQEASAEEAPLDAPATAPAGEGWVALDAVAAIVNDEVITFSELDPAFQREQERVPITTPEEHRETRDRVLYEMVLQRLRTQAGRDLGLATDEVDRRVGDHLRREKKRLGLFQYVQFLQDQGLDATRANEVYSENVYASAWERSVRGEGSASERPRRDRFVRPGELYFLYEQNRDQFAEPDRVQLQRLLILSSAVGGEEAARDLCLDVRQRALGGEDLGLLVEEFGAVHRETRGILESVPVPALIDPELRRFAARAAEGEISAVLPQIHEDQVVGFTFVKLLDRELGSPPRAFGDSLVQRYLSREALRIRDLRRLATGERDLVRNAYVWPPSVLERPGP